MENDMKSVWLFLTPQNQTGQARSNKRDGDRGVIIRRLISYLCFQEVSDGWVVFMPGPVLLSVQTLYISIKVHQGITYYKEFYVYTRKHDHWLLYWNIHQQHFDKG